MAGDDDVPKLPRGRGIKLSTPEIFRILVTAGMLVAVLLLARPCGNAVGNFVKRFDNGSGSGSSTGARGSGSSAEPTHYVQLKPGMTEEETKAAIEQAKQAAGSGSGPAR
jgi:hypothetical protein